MQETSKISSKILAKILQDFYMISKLGRSYNYFLKLFQRCSYENCVHLEVFFLSFFYFLLQIFEMKHNGTNTIFICSTVFSDPDLLVKNEKLLTSR